MSWGIWNHSCSLASCPTPTCEWDKQKDKYRQNQKALVSKSWFHKYNPLLHQSKDFLSPSPSRTQAPQSMPSSVCLERWPSLPLAGQRSSDKRWGRGQQPAGGIGLARCGRRSGLYPVPHVQHANPSENPRRNSRLGGQEKEVNQEEKEEFKKREKERKSVRKDEGSYPEVWTEWDFSES